MVLFLPELAMAATGEIAMEGAAFWPRNEVVRQVIM